MTDARNPSWATNLLGRESSSSVRSEPSSHPPKTLGTSPEKQALAAPDKQALARALLAQRLKKRSRFSEPDKAKIFGRFLQGENPDDIGASFGVSGMTIRKLVDDAILEGGLEPPKRGKRKPKGSS